VNKNDLVAAVATAAGLSKVDAAAAVDGVFSSITDALASGGDVRLVGFGTFSVAQRAASEGRNPRTGEKSRFLRPNSLSLKPVKALKTLLTSNLPVFKRRLVEKSPTAFF